MSNFDFEPDPNFEAAQAPVGFEFDEAAETLNAVPADSFPPDVAQDVDGLLWLGYLTDSFQIYNHSFVIKTLTRGEKLAITEIVKEYEDTLGMADAYETAQVAASLLMVDNHPIGIGLEMGGDPRNRIRDNFKRVQGWYDPVITSLFERVAALNARQIRAFIEFQSK